MTFQTIVGQHFQFFWYIYNRCGDSFDSEWLSTPIPVGATGGEWVWSGCAHFWTHSSADHWRGQFSHARFSPISTKIIDICAAEHCAQFTTTSPHPIFSYSPSQEPKKTAEALVACIDIGTLVGVHTILELWAWLTPLLQTSHTIFISPSNNFSPQLSVSEWKRTDSHDKCLVKSGECSHVTMKMVWLSLIWCINLFTGMGGRELSMEYKWIRERGRRKNPTLSSVETRHPHVQQVTRTSCQSKYPKCIFFSPKGNHDLQISLKADFEK